MMPGEFGSWDEFCEIVTWSQLGIHQKPMGILNVLGYYDSFISMTDRAVNDGFVRASHNDMIVMESDPVLLLSRFAVVTFQTKRSGLRVLNDTLHGKQQVTLAARAEMIKFSGPQLEF